LIFFPTKLLVLNAKVFSQMNYSYVFLFYVCLSYTTYSIAFTPINSKIPKIMHSQAGSCPLIRLRGTSFVRITPTVLQFSAAERIESVKAGAIGGIVGATAATPFLYLSSTILSAPNPTGQWEFQTDMASIEGALFAICYRYIVRQDGLENEMLKTGALGAFIIIRTLPLISVPSSCSSVPLQCKYFYVLDPATIPQVALHGLEVRAAG